MHIFSVCCYKSSAKSRISIFSTLLVLVYGVLLATTFDVRLRISDTSHHNGRFEQLFDLASAERKPLGTANMHRVNDRSQPGYYDRPLGL